VTRTTTKWCGGRGGDGGGVDMAVGVGDGGVRRGGGCGGNCDDADDDKFAACIK